MTTTNDSPPTPSPVDELMAQMTPAEKAGQLTQFFYFGSFGGAGAEAEPGSIEAAMAGMPKMVEGFVSAGGATSLLFVTDPAEINRLQRLAVEESRLGIPLLFGFDVIHGLRTILPVPIAMAASWDPETIERGQSMAAREARAVGIHWTFAPMVDIARDPRWGRIIEGAGEDPYLGAAVAAAQVRGFQGGEIGAPEHVIAGPKHFAGYGAALGGRDYDEVNLSDSELWNVYLAPFKAAIDAGAGNVMTAYMDLNGVPASGNSWLFTEVLRDTWGFEGFVVSDANAVRSLVTHGFAADLADAAARGVNAGVDIEMTMFDPAYGHLTEALDSGAANARAVDASVRRVLDAKFKMGLFDTPYVDEDRAREVLADPAHREVARLAAERSAVLLRNEDALLPLDAGSLTSIAVIGALADSKRDTLGPWVFDFDLDETVTVFEGIRARVGDAMRVDFAPGFARTKRLYPSPFDRMDGYGAGEPDDFDEDAEFARAVELAGAVGRRGRRGRRVAEPDRRTRLAVVARTPGRAARVAAGRRRHGHTRRAAGHERPAARPALGRRARAGDPRHLVPGHPRRRGRGEPAVRRRLPRRQAPLHLAPHRGPGADHLLAHRVARSRQPGAPLLERGRHSAVPVRARPELRALRVRQPRRRSALEHGRRHGHRVRRRGQHRRTQRRRGRPALHPPTVRVGIATGSRTQGLPTDRPRRRASHAPSGSRSDPTSGGTGTPPARDWVTDASTFDVWVGGDSTAPLSTTFEVTSG